MSLDLPEAFAMRMQDTLGDQYDAFQQALALPPPISIRLNKMRNIQIPKGGTSCPWEKDGYYLPSRPYFTYDPDFHSGSYYVQEASSMLIGNVLEQLDKSNWKLVIDLCAAPGGKTTHMLSKLKEDVLLIANEVVATRLGSLKQNLIKWGYGNSVATMYSVENLASSGVKSDLLLVDAPCSGEGMFRKDVDSIGHWSVKNLITCEMRQNEILSHVPSLNKVGGYLIYSTCTYNPNENIQQVNTLIEQGYYTSLGVTLDSDWGVEKIEKGKAIGYQCYPHKVRGEGLFFALLQRTDKEFRENRVSKFKLNEQFKRLTKDMVSKLPTWLLHYHHRLLMDTDSTIYLNPDPEGLYSSVIALKPLYTLGSVKGKEFIPDHALAMLHTFKAEYPQVELTEEQALLYLKKEANFELNLPTKGWYIVTCNGNALGFIKVLDQRINNYFPNNMRILK